MSVPTRFGVAKMVATDIAGVPVLRLSRHGAGHRVPPHRAPYAAMACALRQLECSRCIATAAVGSLRADWPTGTLVLPDGMIDLSGRNQTLFPDKVAHTDITHPFAKGLRAGLRAVGPSLVMEGTYVNGNGPRYETPQEIEAMRTLGGDLVGMTAGTEAVAMREAGIDYAVVCAVTNLAAGLSTGELGHEEVAQAMCQAMVEIGGVFERYCSSLVGD